MILYREGNSIFLGMQIVYMYIFCPYLGFLSQLYSKLYVVIRIVYYDVLYKLHFVLYINYIDLFSLMIVIQFQNLHYLGKER